MTNMQKYKRIIITDICIKDNNTPINWIHAIQGGDTEIREMKNNLEMKRIHH